MIQAPTSAPTTFKLFIDEEIMCRNKKISQLITKIFGYINLNGTKVYFITTPSQCFGSFTDTMITVINIVITLAVKLL